MLHPDYQYDATRIPALVEPILNGEKDLMLGSRFLGDPLAGGMPRWKYISNRFLTSLENLASASSLEYHTGSAPTAAIYSRRSRIGSTATTSSSIRSSCPGRRLPDANR